MFTCIIIREREELERGREGGAVMVGGREEREGGREQGEG